MDLQQLEFPQTSDTGDRGKAGAPVPVQGQTSTLEEISHSSDNLPAHRPELWSPDNDGQ